MRDPKQDREPFTLGVTVRSHTVDEARPALGLGQQGLKKSVAEAWDVPAYTNGPS